MTSLSIVIPCHDVGATIDEQLRALLNQAGDGDLEVIAIENGSRDDTRDRLERWRARDPRVHVVTMTGPASAAAARNHGAARATGDRLAMIDGDDVVADGWLAAVSSGLDDHPIVTGPLDLTRLNPPWLARSRGGSTDGARRRYAGVVPMIPSGNFACTRQAWERIGGFSTDPELRACEDIEFSMRAWEHGLPVFVSRAAVVHYRLRSSAAELWRQGLAYGRGRARMGRLMRDRGHQPPAPLAGWRSWAWLVVHLPDLRTAPGRAVWSWVAGNRVGQVRGSVASRIVQL